MNTENTTASGLIIPAGIPLPTMKMVNPRGGETIVNAAEVEIFESRGYKRGDSPLRSSKSKSAATKTKKA